MNAPLTAIDTTAWTMRHAFDRSFSLAPATQAARFEEMLAVRIGGDPYVIPVAGIRALYAHRCVVALPTPLPELLGVATFRGQVAPVYDLAALLGYAPRNAPWTAPHWFVLARWPDTVALAFDAFEALLLVPPEHVVAPADAGKRDAAQAHLHGAVHAGEALRPIVHLPSVLDDIQKRARQASLARSDEP